MTWAQFQAWLNTFITGTDATFQVNDPLPFLMVHHWDIPLLLLDHLRKLKAWRAISFHIGVIS